MPSGLGVSEGQGFGMVITAFMAGHDPDAKAIFDGLYGYFRAHPSEINRDLMAWRQLTGCVSSADSNSASDGDIDVAYALLLADRQWGSAGTIDYRAAALRVIAAIGQDEINPGTMAVKLGDWAIPGDVMYDDTRTSDFITDHFRSFFAATGDTSWLGVVDRSYALVNTMQSSYSPATGLLPDFIRHVSSSPSPAGPNFLESPYDGAYSYNACRDPFRLGLDYLLNGDARALHTVQRLNGFIRAKTWDDPTQIRAGYRLNGTAIDTFDISLAFTAPFMVGAMVDTGSQAWLNDLWTTVDTTSMMSNDYYGNTLKMLAIIVVSGNWWDPEAERTVEFAGLPWSVKTSAGAVGPGPNVYSDSVGNVAVDSAGSLHLRITHVGSAWRCAELGLDPSLGYGRYAFQLSMPTGPLDRDVVLGLFTWDDAPAQHHREIDIEVARWGDAVDSTNAQFVVQPYSLNGNLVRWTLPADADSLTLSFDWQPGVVHFLAVRGHKLFPPYDTVLTDWYYVGPSVPSPGGEHARMNVWLDGGNSPSDGLEAEVLVSSFQFNPPLPVPSAPALIAPSTGASVETAPVTMMWTSSATATSYAVQIASDSAMQMLVHEYSTSTDTSVSVPLPSDGTYWWRVRAGNVAARGPWSDARMFVFEHRVAWRLVSLPHVVTDPRPMAVYPGAVTAAYAFLPATGYVTADSLKNGIGYWVKFGADLTENTSGGLVAAETLALAAGWNLIGSISSTVASSAITSDPPGLMTSNFFGFGGSYSIIDTIAPGLAYWVHLQEGGVLIVGSAEDRMDASARIRIVPSTDLPPAPPGGSVGKGGSGVPVEFALDPPYPNPFNPATTIRFVLPATSRISLAVFDILGRRIATLEEGVEGAGTHQIAWTANGVSSGIYLCRLEATSLAAPSDVFVAMRKLLIIK